MTSDVDILYVANARIPGLRAHSIQIMRSCDALHRAGAKVELWIPTRMGLDPGPPSREGLLGFYGVDAAYTIHRLRSVDLIDFLSTRRQRAAFLLQSITFAASVRRRLAQGLCELSGRPWIYVRDPHTLAFLALGLPDLGLPDLRSRLVFEAHSVPGRRRSRRRLAKILADVSKVLVLNSELADSYRELGVSTDALAVIPADAPSSEPLPDRERARTDLGLGAGDRAVMYTGSLGVSKGVDSQLAAARRLGPEWSWILVGGAPAAVDDLRRKVGRDSAVRIEGAVPPAEVDKYLAAADILVATGTAREPASALWTSPMKLFEYDRARRPIVLSDLPAFRAAARELPTQDHLFWCAADDPDDLVRAVRRAWDHRDRIEARPPAEDGRLARAVQILEHLKT